MGKPEGKSEDFEKLYPKEKTYGPSKKKKIHGKEPKTSPLSPLSREEKEERRKKFDPIDEIKALREKQNPNKLKLKSPSGGMGAGMRRFNRGGKV